jgi:hypothetical protein
MGKTEKHETSFMTSRIRQSQLKLHLLLAWVRKSVPLLKEGSNVFEKTVLRRILGLT